MYYSDRKDAGQALVSYLEKYRNDPSSIVIALPRGGVVVAYEIAQALQLPLDIISPRKIGAPGNPEFAIGAITEDGEGIFDENTIEALGVTPEYLKKTIEQEKQKAQQRLALYRQGRKPVNLAQKTVIIVDDGLATGATMKAAIKSIKARKAKQIIVAVPVSPPDTYREIEHIVDAIVCPHCPLGFMAVGQFYQHFAQTEDEEVIDLMQKSQGGPYGTNKASY
jgi:putative phosphoribosyl transferase